MAANIVQLIDYHVWANARIMNHLAGLPSEVFIKPVDVGFATIAAVIHHMMSADALWFARIRGDRTTPEEGNQFASLQEAIDYTNNVYTQMRAYVGSIPDPEKIMTYRTRRGVEVHNTISDIVYQIVNHGSYHRGNISTMLRLLGHEGVLTDYIAYIHSSEQM
ncbi:DinB family protein [Paenibacillus sp. UNC217MF]|uniref:DinB family protein n=1 Tax=Paenibacillus sp. UNC217MF TaxID=1449062 RepID=UPI00048BBA7D|nr:DinB family protein [Paenibacillus sp. UNC217MF]